VESGPIKGTARTAEGLLAKDHAENVMIVDLVRNDLGRVAATGSVEVPELCTVEEHPGLVHLVSTVRALLRPDVGWAEILTATFPPGSVTGAPKIAAQGVIAELESTGREAYTGAIGFASPGAGLELSVAIRTFEVAGPEVWLGVGGGVVADSDPSAEARECAVKAGPLLEAIGARGEFGAAGEPDVPRIARRGPRPIPRPDPAAGVFSTLLLRDGLAIAAARHLARLRASVAELYGAVLPAETAERIEAAAAAHSGTGRMRVEYVPGTAEPALSVTALKLGRPPPELATVTLPGGIGAHKWADRRLLDTLAGQTAPALPLLVDLDGYVLESWGANVFARLAGGTLVTPPLDGRILPGVARGRLLEVHTDAREEPLALERLRAADEIYVTGSLGGAERVRALDGVATGAAATAQR
jgi:para-aminobenzoate synthetase/4-amino-4-deoxychorismate lyase